MPRTMIAKMAWTTRRASMVTLIAIVQGGGRRRAWLLWFWRAKTRRKSLCRYWQGERRVGNESGMGTTEGVGCALLLNEWKACDSRRDKALGKAVSCRAKRRKRV